MTMTNDEQKAAVRFTVDRIAHELSDEDFRYVMVGLRTMHDMPKQPSIIGRATYALILPELFAGEKGKQDG